MLGENGTGKTTFIRMLAGNSTPDSEAEVPAMNVSFAMRNRIKSYKGLGYKGLYRVRYKFFDVSIY